MCIWYYDTTTDDLPRNRSFVPPLEPGYAVTSVEGCDDTYPSTGNCPQNGIKPLFIYGRELTIAVNVSFDYGDHIVSCMNHIYSTNMDLIVCTEYAGFGTNGVVLLHSPASAEFVFYTNENTTLSFQDTSSIDCGPNNTCNNNGRCDPLYGCQCVSDALNGYWNGTYCDRCQDLKYGPQCTRSCDGPCTCINGKCSDGVNGTGCVCTRDPFLGYWDGETCELCLGNYFGDKCTRSCPGRINETAACGLGKCSEGLYGTGMCTCKEGALLDSTGNCTVCAVGYFGANCDLCARPNASAPPCNGHGICSDTIRGDGTCACVLGYLGAQCDYNCAVAVNRSGLLSPCGRGVCNRTNVCICEGNWTVGSDGACSLCLPGHYGTDCEFRCPNCHRGSCNDGALGDGKCTCNLGAWGEFCDGICPGPSNAPCYNHGTCSLEDGTCSCYSNSTHGFWRGIFCNLCQSNFLSDGCMIACPVTNNAVCNARGVCYNGNCTRCLPRYPDTFTAICGNDCGVFNEDCDTTRCPKGRWGETCSGFCPAAVNNASNACRAKGFCNSTNGKCECHFGFAGDECELQCPTGVGSTGIPYACSGHGLCQGNGTCSCNYGYYGDACDAECPGGADNVCNGNGFCTSLGDCQCSFGFHGVTCSSICPGGVSTPCNARGTCNKIGQCACIANATFGYFAGTSCDQCRVGYAGPNCTDECSATTASTINQVCICNPGFAGKDCTTACPTNLGGDVCNGHGTCNDGTSGDGTCTCDKTWYGSSCSVQCSTSICLAALGMINSMCVPETGACACLASATSRFGGKTCAVCEDGYWGVMCNLPCSCSSHGACQQWTGECQCYADDARGYWAGTQCTVCRDGYIGDKCTQRNLQIGASQSKTSAVQIADPAKPGNLKHDAPHSMFFTTGSQPILFFSGNVNSMNFTGSLDVGGTLLSVQTKPAVERALDVWTLDNGTIARKRISYSNISEYVTLPTLFDVSHHQFASQAFDGLATHHRRMLIEQAAWSGDAERVELDTDSGIFLRFVSGTVTFIVLQTGQQYLFNVSLTAVSWVQFDKSGTLVTLSGSNATAWAAEVFSITQSSGLVVHLATVSNATHPIAECGDNSTTTCKSAAVCAFATTAEVLYCVLRRQQTGIVFVTIELPSAAASSSSAHVLRSTVAYTLGTDDFNVTAVAEDVYFGTVMVAFNLVGSSSFVIQMNVTSAAVVSLIPPPVSSVVKIIPSMLIDSTNRAMYVLRQAAFSIDMDILNLFAVNSVTPNVLDSSGSTPVSVVGYGFGPLSPLYCDFGQGILSNATIVDNFTIACNSTMQDLGGAACAIAYFNVVSGSRASAATNTPLNRVAGATLLAVTTDQGYVGYSAVGSAAVLTVSGFGFVSSSWARCRLMYNGTSVSDLNPVAYVDGNTVTCTLPALSAPTLSGSYIEYSHDGTVYGASKAPFAIVGDAYDLVGQYVATSLTSVTVPADDVVRLPAMMSYLVDVNGNKRGALETSAPFFIATTSAVNGDPETLRWTNASVNRVQQAQGTVMFAGLQLYFPSVGEYTIYMRSAVIAALQSSVTLVVIPGDPYRVSMQNVSRMLAVWSIPVLTRSVLQPSPSAVVVDVANNVLSDISNLPAQVVLQYINAYPNATTGAVYYQPQRVVAAADSAGVYAFTGVIVQTTYDSDFVFQFQASVEEGRNPIGAYTTPLIRTDTCVPFSEYAVARTFTCLPCPDNGICDGTSVVNAMPGFWRSSASSYVFYSCAPPDGNDACTMSIATCQDGYTGPRCSSCTDGYGKSGAACMMCGNSALNWGMSWLIFFVIVALCSVLVVRSIQDACAGLKAETTVVVIKSLVTHAQVLGALTALLDTKDMPAFIADFFSTGGQAYVQVNLSFFSCALTHTAIESFLFSVIVPWVLFGFVLIVVLIRGGILWYLGFRIEKMKRDFNDKRRKLRQKKSMFTKGSDSFQVLAEMGQHLDYDSELYRDVPDDVDPHELALYRMDAFGDDLPTSSDDDDETQQPSPALLNVKDLISAPRPLGSTTIQQSAPDGLKSPPPTSAMAALSKGNTKLQKQQAAIVLHEEAPPTATSVLESESPRAIPRRASVRRGIRIIDTVDNVAAPPAAAVANPLNTNANPLAAKPTWALRFDDGGSEQVAATAWDPSGFAPEEPSTLVVDDSLSVVASSTNRSHQQASKSKGLSLVEMAKVLNAPTFTPIDDTLKLDASAATSAQRASRAMTSFKAAAKKAVSERSRQAGPSSFSKSLSTSGRRLRDVADQVKKQLDVSATGSVASSGGSTTSLMKQENLLKAAYVPTFGFALTAVTEPISVRKQIWHTTAVTLLVIMFLMYPTILKACLSMFPCEDIDYGDRVRSVLVAERTVNCNSRSFQVYRNAAGGLLAAYGLGVPALSVLLVFVLKWVSLNGNEEAAKAVFYFVTGGFRKNMWFWESVTMLRKASILLIIAILTDITERRYVASIAMSVFFVINRYARPYDQQVLHIVESVSLLDIAVTTNLFMLFPYFPFKSNPKMYLFILLLVFIVNMLTLAVFAYGFFTSTADMIFKTSIYKRLTTPSPKEVIQQHERLVAGLQNTRRMCLAVHPRCYDMDEFLYEAYSLAVFANARLEKMGVEVTSHTRRMRKRARRIGENETVVANLVSAMLLPTTSAFATKLRDVLQEATDAILYVSAMRSFVSTQVQQAMSSTDELYHAKVHDCLEELYKAELNVLATSKRLRRALRRLGGSAGEFRDELSTSSDDSDEKFLYESKEDNRDAEGRAVEEEKLFRDYEAERMALNATLLNDTNSLDSQDELRMASSRTTEKILDDDDYFSMIDSRQAEVALRLEQTARQEGLLFDATPAAATALRVSAGANVAASSVYASAVQSAEGPMFHTPDDEEERDDFDYMAILEAGRAIERSVSNRRSSFAR